jgi:hypothetical protein
MVPESAAPPKDHLCAIDESEADVAAGQLVDAEVVLKEIRSA